MIARVGDPEVAAGVDRQRLGGLQLAGFFAFGEFELRQEGAFGGELLQAGFEEGFGAVEGPDVAFGVDRNAA